MPSNLENLPNTHTFSEFPNYPVIPLSKELSFCHKLWFSNFNIVATQCRRPLIFQTMNGIRSNNVNLIYQKFTS